MCKTAAMIEQQRTPSAAIGKTGPRPDPTTHRYPLRFSSATRVMEDYTIAPRSMGTRRRWSRLSPARALSREFLHPRAVKGCPPLRIAHASATHADKYYFCIARRSARRYWGRLRASPSTGHGAAPWLLQVVVDVGGVDDLSTNIPGLGRATMARLVQGLHCIVSEPVWILALGEQQITSLHTLQ
jgi:hypothetical protein